MEHASVIERLEQLLTPKAQHAGLELVAVEVVGASGAPIVRVFLDRPGGIDLDTIAEASRWVSSTLEEADPFQGTYTLEVSSPGIDRPLRTLKDFERFIGNDAVVKSRPIDGRSSFKGRIVGVADGVIEMEADGKRASIPFDTIKKAHLKGEVDLGGDRE